ncbi:hypothetical protein C8F01DRAFT_1063097 [Mycena amicta]|nr:hypothetical protein C8F01DRAFT_1063097 [Mycena amicta]
MEEHDQQEPTELTAEELDQEFQRILAESLSQEQEREDEEDEDLEQEDNDDDLATPIADCDPAFFPYPNRTAMLLDVVDNLGRCRFTGAQMALILHLLKHLGARNVPTLKGLRKIQKEVRDDFGHKPIKVTSALGNVFYTNDLREAIARDFSNPLVAPHLHVYPEEVADGPVSERWQAERALDYPPDQLTPMFTDGQRRWWIEEVAQLKNGQFVIPKTWVMRDGRLTSDAHEVTRIAGEWDCVGTGIQIAAADLEHDFDDILGEYGPDLVWTERSQQFVSHMPNEKRAISGDRDLYVVGVSVWIDDVSGNKSKQYNKFIVMLGQNTAIPGQLLKQEFHIHFMAASQNATTAEYSAVLRDFIRGTHSKPIIAYNAHTKREAAVVLQVVDEDADNPQQSEEASHMISAIASYPCRKCKWGGSKQKKETAQTYHECHECGVPRTAEEIRTQLQRQLRMATNANASAIEQEQKTTGTKDKLTQYWIERVLAHVESLRAANPRRSKADIANEAWQWLQEQAGDKMNPLLDIPGLDPARDTPVEILHTILLGVIKYVWHHLHTNQWSDSDRRLLAIRLQSTDISSMKIPPVRGAYMMQYRNNLIGKHYKTIMQSLAFHVHDICTPEQIQLIKASADLGARVWVSVIDDMEKYIEDLKVAVANVLDAWDAVDPLRIIVKIKLHLLPHLPDDVRRFGPPVRFSTETQEGYNAVFRMCSINSNNQAPSRDIAQKFASMNTVKHLLCGGRWWSSSRQEWSQPGMEVTKILRDDPVFQRHLGWVSASKVNPGLIRFLGAEKHPAIPWSGTEAAKHWEPEECPAAQTLWRRGQYVVAKSGDQVKTRTWVFARDANDKLIMGRVAEIIASVGSKGVAYITLERFLITESRHPTFDWPVIRRPNGHEITQESVASFLILKAGDIEFACSVQHDCRRGKCKPSVMGKQRQEREDTSHDMLLIKHQDDDHFVLNMGSTHNFVDLMRALPPHLYKLKPLHIDRLAFHSSIANKARSLRTTARAKTAAKRRDTAAAKKKKAEEAAAEAQTAADRAEAIAAGAAEDSDEEGEESVGSERDSDVEQDGPPEDEDEDDSDEYTPNGNSQKRTRNGQGGRGGRKRRK